MQKINLNRLWFILKDENNGGFTIVELLLSLSILFIIILVTPSVWSNINHYQPQTERFAVRQFFHGVTDEIQLHRVKEQDQNRIVINTTTNDQIILSKYYDTIRRQVNRTGHEILLRDVDLFTINYTDQYLLIKLTMKSGRSYEKVITLFTD